MSYTRYPRDWVIVAAITWVKGIGKTKVNACSAVSVLLRVPSQVAPQPRCLVGAIMFPVVHLAGGVDGRQGSIG